MERLNLKSIQGFTMGNLTEGSGFLSGKFKIKGTSKEPKIIGDLQFNDIAFRVKELNTHFKSMNDKMVINEKEIMLNKFSISDDENNILIVDGKMTTINYTDFGLSLNVNEENLKALNSKAKDNDWYNGELYWDSRLKVNGELRKPGSEGKIKKNNGKKGQKE